MIDTDNSPATHGAARKRNEAGDTPARVAQDRTRAASHTLAKTSAPHRRLAALVPAMVVTAVFAWIIGALAPGRSTLAANGLCRNPTLIDVAFLLDRSGSMGPAELGDSYNIQIDGVTRALRDPATIPTDGSVAVAVLTFAEVSNVAVQYRVINSPADAEAVATQVEKLKCGTSANPCPVCGSTPASIFSGAIRGGDSELKSGESRVSSRSTARRILLISSDGECGSDCGEQAGAELNRSLAAASGSLEMIVMGRGVPGSGSCPSPAADLSRLQAIVFRQSRGARLEGRVFEIAKGPCNEPFGVCTPSDRERQVREFASATGDVMRGHILNLTVRSLEDFATTQPPVAATLTLRQAIEAANAHEGDARITFEVAGTIRPRTPLPALSAPGIEIDGGGLVTIDGGITAIDQGEVHSDGILIRCGHCAIRNLRIRSFPEAAIALKPECDSCGPVGHNRIEHNVLENNGRAGVLVLDVPPSGTLPNELHNTSNTVSQNDVIDTLIPIDLGGDGRTPNDLCDSDEQANSLLNFPEIKVEGTPDNATISGVVCRCDGQFCTPGLEGATVEIFEVSTFARETASGELAIGSGDRRLITGIHFVGAAVVKSDGSFLISNIGRSPGCGYVATLTDTLGNTSEVSFPCAGFGKIEALPPGALKLPLTTPNGRISESAPQVIHNAGCGALVLELVSIQRDQRELPAIPRRIDDTARFSMHQVGLSGLGPRLGNGNAILLNPDDSVSLVARFNPLIPATLAPGAKPSALKTMPASLASRAVFRFGESSGFAVLLNAQISGEIHLIDPNSLQSNIPFVSFTRNGDSLTVVVYVYDADLDLDKIRAEFFDSKHNPVPLDFPEADLRSLLPSLVPGQSLGIAQEFSNANNHEEVATVEVTVFDRAGHSAKTPPQPIKVSAVITRAVSVSSAERNQPLARTGPTVIVDSKGRDRRPNAR